MMDWPILLGLLSSALLPAYVLLRLGRAGRGSVYRTLAALLLGSVLQPLGDLLSGLGLDLAGDTVTEAGVVLLGLMLIRLWGLALLRGLLPAIRMAPPRILEEVILAVAYVGWGMVRLRVAGMDLGSIVTTSAVITAVVAFALQDTLGNILGGIALQLDRSVKVGDWIKVGDINGRVVDIHWRSTSVETRNWETIVVPNSQLMKGEFLVLGRRLGQPQQWRRWVWFNVGLGAAPGRVVQVVEDALHSAIIPQVAKEPPPNCVLMDFDTGGSGRYALRYWLTDLALDDPTDSAVREHIYSALQRAGIRLSISEQRLHVAAEDSEHASQVEDRELARRLDALSRVELFRQLDAEELATLARRLVHSPFAAGDIVTRQGAEAHWLYILTTGEAAVYFETEDGQRKLVNTLGAGSFFGEFGLMTGAPRTSTVIAASYAECYRLDKTAFQDILLARPALAEDISRILAARQRDLQAVREERKPAGSTTPPDTGLVYELLGRIRHFFEID